MTYRFTPLTIVALVSAVIAATLLVGYLVRRPPLGVAAKIVLLLGIGVFPLITAATGNVQGYEATKTRAFCGSCHVMDAHASDSNDATSTSLASRHGRNALFGAENCYVCHADYGMYGTIMTKVGGMGHVWYYLTEYRNVPLADALKTIHIRKPFPNTNCMQCHSTYVDVWASRPDHKSALADVRSGAVSCASPGCHGYAHPFSKGLAAMPPPGEAPAHIDVLPGGGAR